MMGLGPRRPIKPGQDYQEDWAAEYLTGYDMTPSDFVADADRYEVYKGGQWVEVDEDEFRSVYESTNGANHYVTFYEDDSDPTAIQTEDYWYVSR